MAINAQWCAEKRIAGIWAPIRFPNPNIHSAFLFAMLGAVKVDGFDIVPISTLTGSAPDSCADVRDFCKRCDALSDAWGLTYYTVEELLDYDWKRRIQLPDGLTTYAERAGVFYSEIIPQLEALCDGDYDSVRLFVYFDT